MTKTEKCSSTQKHRIVIHKDNEEKRVYENELNYYYSLGWSKGWSEKHRFNCSNSLKGKSSWNKGVPVSDDRKQKISNGLKEYFKTNNAWNKGLTAETDDRVKDNVEKTHATTLSRYGKVFPSVMDEKHKRNIGLANKGKPKRKLTEEQLLIKTTKQYLTRKKNGTTNTSNEEKQLYEELLTKYNGKTIYKQYKDKVRYPFYCDFYVLEDDLFIELNAHWTHGGRPYDANDADCQKQLQFWQEKAKTSKFYENAIQTWTVRDVKKLEYAKKYNLNYKVIY